MRDVHTRIKVAGLPVDLKTTGLCLFVGSQIDSRPYRLRKGKRVVPPSELPVF